MENNTPNTLENVESDQNTQNNARDVKPTSSVLTRVFFAIVTVSLLGFSSYLWYQNSQLNQQLQLAPLAQQDTNAKETEELSQSQAVMEKEWQTSSDLGLKNQSFWKTFTLHHPADWQIHVEERPEVFFNVLTLTASNGDTLKISQIEGDAGVCIFPDDPRYFGELQGMANKMSRPIVVNRGNEMWKVAIGHTDTVYTVCASQDDAKEEIGITPIGIIKLDFSTPENLGKMVEVLERVEIN